jgi:hypothetical protein
MLATVSGAASAQSAKAALANDKGVDAGSVDLARVNDGVPLKIACIRPAVLAAKLSAP